MDAQPRRSAGILLHEQSGSAGIPIPQRKRRRQQQVTGLFCVSPRVEQFFYGVILRSPPQDSVCARDASAGRTTKNLSLPSTLHASPASAHSARLYSLKNLTIISEAPVGYTWPAGWM